MAGTMSKPQTTSGLGEIHSCRNCPQRKASLFRNMHFQELDKINEGKCRVHFLSGEIIYKEGSKPVGLFCLQTGKVKISRLGVSGNEQIVGMKKSLDFIGLRALLEDQNYYTTATALEDSTLCIIDKDQFIDTVRGNSTLALRLLSTMAKTLREADLRMVNLLHKHVRGRLADALLQIYNTYGATPDGILALELKRADLAALANMTTANAIRILSSFAREKIIEVDKRTIRILDWSTLRLISEKGY
jgi:CRP-like cAMP-binding protein